MWSHTFGGCTLFRWPNRSTLLNYARCSEKKEKRHKKTTKNKKHESMVFDHTPPILAMVFLFRFFSKHFFLSMFWVSCNSNWILFRNQTLENMFETNFQTRKLFLSFFSNCISRILIVLIIFQRKPYFPLGGAQCASLIAKNVILRKLILKKNI